MDVFSSDIELESQPIDFKREGIKIGIINGLFALALMYISYFMGMDAFMNQQYISTFLPYMMMILLIRGFQLRKKNGGYLSFKEAIKYSFVSYVFAAILIAIGTYILFNIIDKDLTEKTFRLGLEKTRAFMDRMGASDEEIEKTLGKMDKQKPETGFKNILLGTGTGLILDFVKSLLIAITIKKEKPAFLQQ